MARLLSRSASAGAIALYALVAAAAPADAARVTLVPASGGAAAVEIAGRGLDPRSRAAVLARGDRIARARVDWRGRLRVRVELPSGRPPRRLSVPVAGRRFVLPLRTTSGHVPVASASADSRGRRLVLEPYRAPSGTSRVLRGRDWAGRVRAKASIAGVAVGSARTDRRGRFAMALDAIATPGARRVVVRAGGGRLAARLVVSRPPAAPPPAPAASPGAPVIAAAGDIACAPGSPVTYSECHHAAVSDLLLGGDLTAVLPLGDLQYPNASLSEFQGSYAPTWGRADAIARPALGNREYRTGSPDGYFAYFGARAGPSPGGYYSYDIGSWHLIALNSNCAYVPCGAGSEQETWLRADLAAHPGACQLAYWHAPLFNSGYSVPATEMTRIWQVLNEARVDVVLSGHDHHYERFARQDAAGAADPSAPREFIVGTGGASHASEPGAAAPNSEIRNYGTFGVLRLTLGAAGYDWRFAPEAGWTFTDAGSETCR